MSSRLDGSEKVLVVPRDKVEHMLVQGFHPVAREDVGMVLDELLEPAFFLPRTEVLEHDDPGLAFKQIVAYGCLTRRGRVFAFRRPAKGGDVRLQAKFSVGLGGHANPIDATTGGLNHPSPDCLSRCMLRELHEEVRARGISLRVIGLLNDDENDVGRRHLGVVFRCENGSDHVASNRLEIEPIGWLTANELKAEDMPWETWSGFLVDRIGDVLG